MMNSLKKKHESVVQEIAAVKPLNWKNGTVGRINFSWMTNDPTKR